MNDEVLGTWSTVELPNCAYALRLRARDRATVNCEDSSGHVVDTIVSVNVGSCGDFDSDDDGDVDLFDYGAFSLEFKGPLP